MAIESRTEINLTAERFQHMLDSAPAYQTITLPAGRITGSFVIDRPLTLRGAGAEETLLTGDGSGPVLAVEATEGTVRIADLSINHGCAFFGGGVSIDNGTKVEIHGCLLSQNRAPSGRGGAVAIDVGELLVSECTIAWNAAKVGGGVYAGGDARVKIVGTIVDENLSLRGGGLAIEDGAEVDVWTCRFDKNQADDDGHHLWAIASQHRHPNILVSNSLLGPSAGKFGRPIANHGVFSAEIGLDNTAIARDFKASVLLG